MGIDPGLTRCGVGVVDGTVGRPPVFVAVGVVRTSPDLDVAHRLLQVEAGLERWFTECSPDVVAIERVFAQHNTASVIDTAQAAGVAALVAARRGLPVTFHTPSEVKAAITGSGRADKAQVTSMVTMVLKLGVPPRPADAADALALAVCHAWRGGHTNRYAALAAAARGK
ncbi:crossover junction endodeoxyribonuclease RuvC [[Pseudopropionibacterium] massiliense]|uniref:crossover junction endodeoxyribonuclease RuvC n=1 Tax=[Pseudopropionibacterium] massiliense TaxID=2220000 RepID=UPI001A912EEA|nr:crossover junction endodeoxyribonuclease RuvC [[Pseudopropionibacterium] massiliense]